MIGLAKLASGAGHVALADRPERDPDAGEVVVEVRAAGVCGTDLHIELGEFASVPPVTMGHELSGVVVGLGDAVDPRWADARVVSETYFSTCEACEWCRAGRPNLCPDRCSIGSFVDGAFAPRLIVPARNLHRIPDWLSHPAASMTEPLACVCQCLLDPSVVAVGDDVLVAGPGPIGLLAAQVARASGGTVALAGLPSDDVRLAAAADLGFAVEVVDDAGPLARFSSRLGADVVVECSGSEGGATLCLNSVRRGGRYVQVGVFGKPVEVPLDRVFEAEAVLTSGFASTPRSWRRALGLIERRSVDLEALVSEVASLPEWERVFADLRAGRAIKIVFDPSRP